MPTNTPPAEPESRIGQDLDDNALNEILTSYEQTMRIPTVKRPIQLIVCPVGLIGAGKTTVMKPLAERLSLLRISTDEIRHLLQDRGFNYVRTKEIAVRLINTYTQQGYSIAIDADCAGPSTREAVRSLTDAYDLRVVWLHIAPPESFILNKLRTHEPSWLFKNAEQAVENYLARKPIHEHLDLPFLYTFDTSRADLPQQIDEAVTRIEAIT